MTFLGQDADRVELGVPGVEAARAVLSWAARSHAGWQREVNEDSVISHPPIFAVADGMGGHAAGDQASAAVVARLAEAAEAAANGSPVGVDQLDEALQRAAQDIDELSFHHPAGAGTTVTGAVLSVVEGKPGFLVFNIGDSRVYGLTARGLSRITVDHSVVQELIDAGLITERQAENHPESNIITRSVGFNEPPRPDLWGVALRPGLRLLICSDGLTKEVDDRALEALLAERLSAADTADALIAAALDAGGRDNVSLIVLDVLELRGVPDAEAAPQTRGESPV